MRLLALSDVHLSGNPPTKPMDVFGPQWKNHRERIIRAWQEHVQEDDYVLIGGDISWAMRLEGAVPDLYLLMELPGKKILLRGNHDYWWSSVGKMKRVTGGKLLFLYNNFIPIGDVAICGTRGWLAPRDQRFTEADETVFAREVSRLDRSLAMAREAGYQRLIATTHYPPFNERKEPTEMLATAARYGVTQYIYGHLHDAQSFRQVPTEWDGMQLYLTSADYLQFVPTEIPLA